MDAQLNASLQQIQQLQSLQAQLSDQAHAAWLVPSIASGVVGLLLWLTGRRLARPLLVTLGLLVGVASGAFLGRSFGADGPAAVVWLVVAGVAGGLLAWLLFRVGIAATLAVLLFVAGPLLIVALGNQAPLDPSSIEPHWPHDVATTQPLQALRVTLADLWNQAVQQLDAWWRQVPAAQTATMVGLAIGGAVVGLVLGLVLPFSAAGLATSLLGGAMILVGVGAVVRANTAAAPAWLPGTPRQFAVALGLITVLGTIVQWTIWRRRADK